MPDMKLYVMRGLPGAGKSHATAQLPAGAIVASADHYMVDRQGDYRFDPSKLGAAHAACRARLLAALAAECQVVVLDNTNIQIREYQWALDAAALSGHSVTIVELFDGGGLTDAELSSRNSHGVPADSIARMRARWEPTPTK